MVVTGFFCFFLVVAAGTVSGKIHALRPYTSVSGGHNLHTRAGRNLHCLSWRLAVETNNIIDWSVVPKACTDYVGHYMIGEQYRRDCDAVADAAILHAKSLEIPGDGMGIWIFDIDETSLSNLPYYARPDVAFGSTKFNNTKFGEWIMEGNAPAIPATLRLYNTLISLGMKVIFLTGTLETYKEVRVENLKKAGYDTWEKLILMPESSTEQESALVYKSRKRDKLVEAGYIILGNIGDQWSDILGTNPGNRTFKLPDPMYYIA